MDWKVGRWPKIFRLKLEKSLENLPFEIRIILDIDGIPLEYKTFENRWVLIGYDSVAKSSHTVAGTQKCPKRRYRRRLLKHKIRDF
jgi:hypothetical protein